MCLAGSEAAVNALEPAGDVKESNKENVAKNNAEKVIRLILHC